MLFQMFTTEGHFLNHNYWGKQQETCNTVACGWSQCTCILPQYRNTDSLSDDVSTP